MFQFRKKDDGNALTSFWKRVERRSKFIFAVSLFFAAVTHLSHFAAIWANEDNLAFAYRTNTNKISSGRWCNLFYFFPERILPGIYGTLMLLFLCLAAVYTVKVLNLQNEWLIAASAGLLVTYPTLAILNGYVPDTFTYPLAILLVALAVYVTMKYKKGWIAGAVLLGVSMGWYQAFLCYCVGLCIIALIRELFLSRKDSAKGLWTKAFSLLAMGAAGGLFYFGMMHLSLWISGRSMNSYKGLDTMGPISIGQVPQLLARTYGNVILQLFGRKFWQIHGVTAAATAVILLLTAGLLVYGAVKLKIWKTPGRLLCLTALVLLFPLGINLIDFMAVEKGASTLNIYALVLVYLLPAMLLEHLPPPDLRKGLYTAVGWLLLPALFVTGGEHLLLSQTFYQMESRYLTYSQALLNRILARIEGTEAFNRTGTVPKVAVVVNRQTPPYQLLGTFESYEEFYKADGIRGKFIGFNDPAAKAKLTSSYKLQVLLSNLCGVDVEGATAEEVYEIVGTDEYLNMGVWPAQNSVAEIGDMIVVNMAVPCSVNARRQGSKLFMAADCRADLSAYDKFEWRVYRDGDCVEKCVQEELAPFEYAVQEKGVYSVRLIFYGEVCFEGENYGYIAREEEGAMIQPLKFWYDSQEIVWE